jgi:hypothetical protein
MFAKGTQVKFTQSVTWPSYGRVPVGTQGEVLSNGSEHSTIRVTSESGHQHFISTSDANLEEVAASDPDPRTITQISDQIIESKIKTSRIHLNEALNQLCDSVQDLWAARDMAAHSDRVSQSVLSELHSQLETMLTDLTESGIVHKLTDEIDRLTDES